MKLHKIYRSSKMAYGSLVCGLLLFASTLISFVGASDDDALEYMSEEERDALKEEARDMFYHAYNAYMDNAYPADELMPLSCKGRYRGSEPNRGDIDTALGNFSLTLVDTLDTLVLLGDLEEFQNAVKLVIRDVSFNTDVIVSVFETNIRMLGGLLSGHILAEYLQQRADIMPWYTGELLDLAKDLGYKLLPAFNTTTGIPYGRINLKHGMKGIPVEVTRETCTACAGSMILEMAALSRLTGEPIFEEKAQRAMDSLWRMRHRGTDLMGTVLNVNSGDWVRRDSGVGAGIDSYYEYCLKAYILLGDEKYLGRFNRHYQAVMKYISQGPMLLDVHMHRPNTNSKNFMDALLAFWPGLQVLKGDIKPAVETHEMLYQVIQRHNFIPEAFTTDFQVHWGHHPLRPEFLESTYFLYRATGDHYYLGVGRKVLRSLQTYARVPCGYAAVSDVRTNKHDDTMDSFVLSETFKYLYLLFAEPSDLTINPDEFVFTTEGHLLPLTLASIGSNSSSAFEKDTIDVDAFDRTCPNSLHLFPASVRQPLRNMVEDVCPRRMSKRRLHASQFQANNLEHLSILSDMGITILKQNDGRVQLLHTFSNAKTAHDGEEGLLFMQEMVEMSKMQSQQAATRPQVVTFTMPAYPRLEVTLLAGPAHFGPELHGPNNRVTGKVVYAEPATACEELSNADKLIGKIVIMDRGNCMFVEKARRIQKAGALAGIVLDNVLGSSAATFPMFAMSGDGNEVDHVVIPLVFLFNAEATRLLEAIVAGRGQLTVTIGEYVTKEEIQLKAPNDLSMFEKLRGSLREFLVRQIFPQESPELFSKQYYANGNPGARVVKEPDFIREEDRNVVIEYQHLKAEISTASDDDKIRITASSIKTAQLPQEPQEMSEFENKWRFLRKMFVNQIFANSDQGSSLYIAGSTVESYYKQVQSERGIPEDVTRRINLSAKVVWFLKELSELGLDLSVAEKTKELASINRRRLELLKQHLFSKMDDITFLKNAALKIKNLKSTNPEMEQLFEELETGKLKVENYSLFGKLLKEIFEGEDENVSRHITLLDHLHQAVENNNPAGIVMDQLTQELSNPLSVKREGISNEDTDADADLKINGGKSKDSAKETLIVAESRKKHNPNSENLINVEDFLLIEIDKGEQGTEDDLTVEEKSTGISFDNFNSANSKKSSDVRETNPDAHTQNESQNVEVHNSDVEILVKGAEILSSIGLTDTLARRNERKKLLREIHHQLKDSQNPLNLKHTESARAMPEEVGSDDPFEDLKSPVWATDESKVAKEFSEFQQKPEIRSVDYKKSKDANSRYQEEDRYTLSQGKSNINEIDIDRSKHIDDEL